MTSKKRCYVAMKNNLVVLKTFNNPIEANIAKGLLESNGIEAILHDENTIYANPVLTTAIGGVKLLVMQTEYYDAIELFNETEKDLQKINKQQFCPKCNSNNVRGSNKHNWVALFIMLISFSFTPNSGNLRKYKCRDCNYFWDDVIE